VDVLLKAVRERTQLAVQRNDFKLEQVPQHLFMNFRVVDEHGRQLGMGRQLATLKAERAGIQSVLNAVFPKIEYWSEFHLGTLWAESLSVARFISIYFSFLCGKG
jgi:hypothetical protein